MLDIVVADHAATSYLAEILTHAGLTWRRLTTNAIVQETPSPHVVILAGRGAADRNLRDWLTALVTGGGAVITVGGTWGLDDLLEVQETGYPSEGYLTLDPVHPITANLASALHVFDAVTLTSTGATSLGHLTDPQRQETIGEAILVNRIGQGVGVAIAANLATSVYLIQHGLPILGDGQPPVDGTAPIDEGILKCDDGIVLSWEHDRHRTAAPGPNPDCPGYHPNFPEGDTPWFSQPVADELRALLLQSISWAVVEIGLPLAMVWPWPDALPAVGLISHDSDYNIDATARTTLRLLGEADITSTWCMMEGPTYPDCYSAATFADVAAAGHEVALHYNALTQDGGVWGRDHLAAQAEWLRHIAGMTAIASNKNHYTRWEGGVEFFRWMEDEGIGSDQTKGPSKKGNVGYPFGSCLPWFPFDTERARFIDVVEVPMQTQDLWWTTPYTVTGPIFDQTLRHHGVAHFLMHQVHLDWRPKVAEALLQVVTDGRDRGLAWWPSGRIAAWERQRRTARVTCQKTDDHSLELTVDAPESIPGFTIAAIVPGPNGGQWVAIDRVSSSQIRTSVTTHHNQSAVLLQWDLPRGRSVIDLRPT